MKIKEVIKLIDKDIEIQMDFLKGDFEEDKPANWRIVGMQRLKKDILNKVKNE
jgi:hypothetical protein